MTNCRWHKNCKHEKDCNCWHGIAGHKCLGRDCPYPYD